MFKWLGGDQATSAEQKHTQRSAVFRFISSTAGDINTYEKWHLQVLETCFSIQFLMKIMRNVHVFKRETVANENSFVLMSSRWPDCPYETKHR